MRKVWFLCFTLIIFCSVLIVKAESCEAATVDPEIKATLEDAWQKNKEMQSMNQNIKLRVKSGSGINYTTETNITCTGTIFKNKKAKWRIEANVSASKYFKSGKTDLYITLGQSGLVVYKKSAKTWEREILQGLQIFKMIPFINPNIGMTNSINQIKDAKLIGKQEIDGKLAQKIEVMIDGKGLEQFMAELPQENSKLKQLDAELIAKMGDIHYILWVTDEGIVRQHTVLTPSLAKLGNILLTEKPITPERKALARELKVTSMEIISDFKNINHAKDFEIPQEVLNVSAVSLK